MTTEDQTGKGDADLGVTGNAGDADQQTTGTNTDTQASVADSPEMTLEEKVEALMRENEGLKGNIAANTRKRQEAEQQALQMQMLVRQQMIAAQGQAAPAEPPSDPISQISDEDYPQGRQIKETLRAIEEKLRRENEQKLQQMQMQQFQASTPDFAEVVGTPGPNGFQWAQHLQEVYQKWPHLFDTIRNSTNWMADVYAIAKMAQTAQRQQAGQQQAQQQFRANTNAALTQPQSLGAAGGGGAVGPQAQVAGMDYRSSEFAQFAEDVATGRVSS